MAATVQAREERFALASSTVAAVLIVAVAIATRIVAWWNPVAHVDDQFYLLAGEELLNGNWPYVDVWDRKPLGLFLLYAGIAWVGGGTILGLNLIATAFAAATAWIIRQIGLHFASPKGATFGALAYLFVIPLVGGQTGQSPVFYNLLMAGAAWLLIDAIGTDHRAIMHRALCAMLLCGLAMTIKQISFIEGAYFGMAFLWLMYRRDLAIAAIVKAALLMVVLALLPTAAMLIVYAVGGQLDALMFATVTSIFLKSGWSPFAKLAGLLFFVLHLTPLLMMAVAGAVLRQRRAVGEKDIILIGWIVVALLGYAAIPHFFDHYALPVVVPLSISAATFFDRRTGPHFAIALAAFCIIQPPIRDIRKNVESRREFDRLAAAIDRARHGGCLYVGDGPTRLYSATRACRVTRYLFPDHLNLVIEADAVGVDTGGELQDILDRRPAVIVTQDRKMYRYSMAYRHFLDRLPTNYRINYVGPYDSPQLVQRVVVWQRKDLALPQS